MLRGLMLALFVMIYGQVAHSAPYAALVMDARTGEVVYSRNADTRLHPASLTKMMTLYVVFSEIRAGRLSLDSRVRISSSAAAKPPSKLGLRAGQTIELRHLIRAAAIKSANDAAAALAEAVSGSESAFARRMTETARAMGLENTQFRNASGLTQSGHYSSARDMAIIGRRLFYDFPQYYNLFSRRSASAGIATVGNTNSRFLNAYPGADGIKTGFTRAAGYNLVASAERQGERVIVSLFGGPTAGQRNARVAELMDLGFERMPRFARVRPPRPIDYAALGAPERDGSTERVAEAAPAPAPEAAPERAPEQVPAKPRGLALATSFLPRPRPVDEQVIARNVTDIVEELQSGPAATIPDATPAPDAGSIAAAVEQAIRGGEPMTLTVMPRRRPADLGGVTVARADPAAAVLLNPVDAVGAPEHPAQAPRAVSGSWAVRIGAFPSRDAAERRLLEAALQDLEAFEGGERMIAPAVRQGAPVFEARFVGLSRVAAENACARLVARQAECETLSP
jgi:D-alanyl-D-alanine carboxypeptidase